MSATQSKSNVIPSIDNEEVIKSNAELVEYITDEIDLERALAEAGKKLVILSFFLLGNQENEKMLQFLSDYANSYRNQLVLLTVDVANSGHLAKTYEVPQIPWFIFLRNAKKVEAYHSISCQRIGKTIRSCLGEDLITPMKTYVQNSNDLEKRLVEAKDRLVLLAFMIPGDESGQRLNIELDKMEDRNNSVYVIKIDVDTCQDLTTKYQIQGVPTIVFIKNKKVLEQMSALEMDKLSQMLTKLTKNTCQAKHANVTITSSVKPSSENFNL